MSELDSLIGKKIERIFLNENYLKFQTTDGEFTFTVDGDCCSDSVFYDFIGVRKLLENGVVKSVKSLDLIIDEKKDKKQYQESIQSYGYELVTEHPEFGEQTSVFSFRNYSNGYYGGSLVPTNNQEIQPEITDDVLCTESTRK